MQELARTMLCETNLPKHLWAEAINTACHVLNRLSIRSILKKTPYEFLYGKQPFVFHFHPFGCKCFIHSNGKDNLGKFDAKSDKGILLGYSSNSRAYRVLNKRTKCVEESMHVVFDDSSSQPIADIEKLDLGTYEKEQVEEKKDAADPSDIEEEEEIPEVDITEEVKKPRELGYVKDNEVLGVLQDMVRTRASLQNFCTHFLFSS